MSYVVCVKFLHSNDGKREEKNGEKEKWNKVG